MTLDNNQIRTEFKKVILSNKSWLILRAGHTQSMICVTLSYFLHCYEKSRRAFIWHSLRESILLSASKNVCHAEIRRSVPELHILWTLLESEL